jgi:hypothetical protein
VEASVGVWTGEEDGVGGRRGGGGSGSTSVYNLFRSSRVKAEGGREDREFSTSLRRLPSLPLLLSLSSLRDDDVLFPSHSFLPSRRHHRSLLRCCSFIRLDLDRPCFSSGGGREEGRGDLIQLRAGNLPARVRAKVPRRRCLLDLRARRATRRSTSSKPPRCRRHHFFLFSFPLAASPSNVVSGVVVAHLPFIVARSSLSYFCRSSPFPPPSLRTLLFFQTADSVPLLTRTAATFFSETRSKPLSSRVRFQVTPFFSFSFSTELSNNGREALMVPRGRGEGERMSERQRAKLLTKSNLTYESRVSLLHSS